MLNENKLKTFLGLVQSSDPNELIWMNGYLNALVDNKVSVKEIQPTPTSKKVTIAYGTETGNSKKVATEFAAIAKSQGIHAKVQSLDQYKLADLNKEEYFFTIISTHGDGEPPAAAKKFYDHVHQQSAKMEHLKYSVLALGDTSYPLFCKAGEDVDDQLYKLGAQRIVPLQKCDIDYDDEASQWFSQILSSLKVSEPQIQPARPGVLKKQSGRKNYKGKILTHINLNDIGSNKETYHIELEATDVQYLPGDSLGIVPSNNSVLVNKIIQLTKVNREAKIEYKNASYTIETLLTTKLNIVHLPERVVKKYAAIVQQDIPETKIDLLDLLKIYPIKNEGQFLEVVNILEGISPRLYSIASSPSAHDGEIHLTVARYSFKSDNQLKFGLASNFLALQKTGELDFYIQPNNNFRLPDSDKDIIMIGPGTGIAPFRSFIAERDATGATGKSWLFFGDQHFVSDFLYQSEIQNWVETGSLNKISTAFSRDQVKKVYVQDRMWQQRADLFQWMENGSYIYICGSKEPMSVDVEKTLLKIIMEEGERTAEDAQQYLDSLKDDARYVLDVY